MACAAFKYNVGSPGLTAMSTQSEICAPGCAPNLSGRLFLCSRCHRQVVICRRCDRGQMYCGQDCALEVRRHNQREARRRYQATDRGRRMHADRSREYRARIRCVTDQGPTPGRQPQKACAAAKAAQPPAMIAAGRVTACYRCGNPVSDRVRLSPISPPRRRQIDDRSSRPMRRRRR
jgi:hypothetical protein